MHYLILPSGLVQYTWDGPVYILRDHGLYFPTKFLFLSLSLKIVFDLANSALCGISSGSSLYVKVRV